MKKLFTLILSLSSPALFAEVQLTPLNLPQIGQVAQFDLSENQELILINKQGELWKIADQTQKLASGFSTYVEPKARYGRIAVADSAGNFILWTAEKTYHSTIPLAEKATMEALNFATIAVTKQNGEAKLVRIEPQGEQAQITATAKTPVLPDAHPLQINFDNENANNGHIAVLAKPDNSTYQHSVLGDDIEAAEIQFLERHSLEPIAEKLTKQGLVFEANRFDTLIQNGKTKLISVMSGDGEGGRAAIIGLANGKLTLEAESEALPSHRWQSPFSFNGRLYAVQMPHLRGNLVEYTQQGERLTEHLISSGLSNHAYGTYETNLAASTNIFAIVPKIGYRQVSVLDKTGSLTELKAQLPAEIRQTKATADKVYLLLKNGEIWVAEDK